MWVVFLNLTMVWWGEVRMALSISTFDNFNAFTFEKI